LLFIKKKTLAQNVFLSQDLFKKKIPPNKFSTTPPTKGRTYYNNNNNNNNLYGRWVDSTWGGWLQRTSTGDGMAPELYSLAINSQILA
jgi:hypothetical protein